MTRRSGQNCSTVVQALNTMSVINPRIRHVAVEGGAFKDEVEALGIKAVPAIYKDGQLFSQRVGDSVYFGRYEQDDKTLQLLVIYP